MNAQRILLIASIVVVTMLFSGACGRSFSPLPLSSDSHINTATALPVSKAGFTVTPLSTLSEDYPHEQQLAYDLNVSEQPDGYVLVEVRAVEAVNAALSYYDLSWDARVYLLFDVGEGDLFGEDMLMAVQLKQPGILTAGHVRAGFGVSGGVDGGGILGKFHFSHGDGSRQTSIAVENENLHDPAYPDDYYSDISSNRGSNFDDVSGDNDGTMFQIVENDKLNDVPDFFFDPQTFMLNVISWVPGDYDLNGACNIYDITPLGYWDSGNSTNSSKPYPALSEVLTWSAERQHFVANSEDYNYYLLRWLDASFDHVVTGSIGTPNDMHPILATDNMIMHGNEEMQSCYLLVSDDGGLSGAEYTAASGDKALLFDTADSGFLRDFGQYGWLDNSGLLSTPNLQVQYIDYYGRNGYNSAGSPDFEDNSFGFVRGDEYVNSGFYMFSSAPWRLEEEDKGWPVEFTAVIAPDDIETWGTAQTQNNGKWDPPGSAYYLYAGTLTVVLDEDNDKALDFGVLTPVGSWTGSSWDVSDLSDWMDEPGYLGGNTPKMLPLIGSQSQPGDGQALSWQALRKTISVDSGELTATRPGESPDTYLDVLADYAWIQPQGFEEQYFGRAFADGQTVKIEARYPRAYDISGVTYAIYLADMETYQNGTPGFFSDEFDSTPKTNVDRVTVADADYTGRTVLTTYRSQPISAFTQYMLMVRPEDGAGNFATRNSRPNTTDLTTTVFYGDISDPTGCQITGTVSHSGSIDIIYTEANDETYPLTYTLGYAVVGSGQGEYETANDFLADYDNVAHEVMLQDDSDDTGWGQDTYTLDGLSADEWYWLVIKVTDGTSIPYFMFSNVVSAHSLMQEPPVFAGVQNVKENGSGSVLVYFNDATDADGVEYRVIYGLRSNFTAPDYADFWSDYAGSQNFVTVTNWIDEANVGLGTVLYAHYIQINGLTNGSAYLFAVRARDQHNPPMEESNTEIIACRPSLYSISALDSSTTNSGFFVDCAAIDYTSGGTQTRVGVSYLTDDYMLLSEPGANEPASELKYVYYDTSGSAWSSPVVVTDYETSHVARGETSITFLNDHTAPAIVFYAASDYPLSDLHADGGTVNPGPSGPHGGSALLRTVSQGGEYHGIEYAEFRSGSWWLDSVDFIEDDYQFGYHSWYPTGYLNGITALYWEHPDGTSRWSPVVSYTSAIAFGGPGVHEAQVYKCRLLSCESSNPSTWYWRPFNWDVNETSDQHKYSANAVIMDVDVAPIANEFPSVLWPIGVDIVIDEAGSDDVIKAAIGVEAGPGYFDMYTQGWFGRVHNSVSVTVDTSSGWAFRDPRTSPPNVQRWNEEGSSASDWFIENDGFTAASIKDIALRSVKMSASDIGPSSESGAVLWGVQGVYYLATGSTTLELVEQFDSEQSGQMSLLTQDPYYFIGLDYDSDDRPGVVYPAWDSTEDVWVLKVAERNNQSAPFWTINTVVYDDLDVFARQATADRMVKIAYLNSDKWVIVFIDREFRPFGSETGAGKMMLRGIVEP